MADLPNAPVKRLLIKGGAERVASSALDQAAAAADDYLVRLGKAAQEAAVRAGRKTVMDEDIAEARRALGGGPATQG